MRYKVRYTQLLLKMTSNSCCVYHVAEFGNYDDQKHTDEFLNDYVFLPPVSYAFNSVSANLCISNHPVSVQHIGPPSVLRTLIDRVSS